MAVSLCCRRIQTLIRNRTCRNQSTGYVVLLPEIGLNLPEDNPLIKDGLPDFSDITPEKCVNTLGKQLLDFEHEVCNIETRLKDEEEDVKGEKEEYRDGFIRSVVKPLQRPGVALDTTWGIVKTIFIADQGKLPSNRYFSLHSRAHKAQYSRFASLPIFQASKGCDVTQLSEEEQRVVERYRLEGNLNGLGLSKDDKEILLNVNKNLYLEKCDFNKRIQVSKDMFAVKIGDPYIVRGFPTNLLENIAEDSSDPTAGPWIASIDPYISNKFLEYCPDHKLRHRVWQNRMKVTSLACEATELQNSTCLEKIRNYRHQQAEVLGYPNYASVSMETKMAGSLESVMSLLESFRQTAFPLHKKEIEDLQEFAAKSGFGQKLQLCDVPYWSRKQKKIIYNFENEELREYFQFENVFAGLLKLCERLFGIRFEAVESSSRWHPDVKFYNIYEGDSVGPVAGFYFDPFARPEKLRSEPEGGWVINLRSAHMADGPRSIPLSSVILNLPPPIYGKPSLLSYSEVNSLFGKFGRLLQQLLCTVTYSEVSGLSYVEWDTVDVTTHFMQQCLEKPNVLKDISGHYITGEKLPVTDMAQVTNHLSATSLCAELYKSVLDLKFNTEKTFWNDIVKEIWPQYFAFPLDPEYNEPLSMTDIVTQDLCAGYYSKIWSRMIAADVFSAFNDEGADETAIGTRFRDTYLAFGGSCDPHETFRRFRGRDPSSESFLRYLRLENSKPDKKTND